MWNEKSTSPTSFLMYLVAHNEKKKVVRALRQGANSSFLPTTEKPLLLSLSLSLSRNKHNHWGIVWTKLSASDETGAFPRRRRKVKKGKKEKGRLTRSNSTNRPARAHSQSASPRMPRTRAPARARRSGSRRPAPLVGCSAGTDPAL